MSENGRRVKPSRLPDWSPLWGIREVKGGYEVYAEYGGETILRTPDYELARRVYVYPQVFRAAHHLNEAWRRRHIEGEEVSDERLEALSSVLGAMMGYADGKEVLLRRKELYEVTGVPEPKTLAEQQRHDVLAEFGPEPKGQFHYDLTVPWVRAMLHVGLDPHTHEPLDEDEDD